MEAPDQPIPRQRKREALERIIELYEVTPQMAMAVTSEGISRLTASNLVDNVSIDVPEPPTG